VTRTEFEVLNVIVLKGTCRTETVSDVLGIPEVAVEETVAALEQGDLVGRTDDLLLPTDPAEPALVAFAADAYTDLRSGPEADGLHERFEKINAQLLQTMAAWQQIDVGRHKVANDHSDRDYDEKVITRPAKLVERQKRIAGALEGCDGFLYDRLGDPEHIGHRPRPAHPLEDYDVEHLELGANHGYSQRYLELRRSAFSEKGR
jgi:hypothetical protein